ncbi:hypothetical protein P5673_032791, partial [Acropora cervicornis]
TSISQALAADDSTDQLTVVIPEGTSSALAADDSIGQQTVFVPEGTLGGELSKFGGFLHKHQYGFRRGRSTAQAVGLLNNFVLDAMDGQKVTVNDALRHDFNEICNWYISNKLTVNVKTKLMLSGSKTMLSSFSDFTFSAGEDQVNRVSSFNYLGVVLDEKCNERCMSIAFYKNWGIAS